MRDIRVRSADNIWYNLLDISDAMLCEVEDKLRGKGSFREVYNSTPNRTFSDALFRCEIERIRRANNY